jgi:hypothetical protein
MKIVTNIRKTLSPVVRDAKIRFHALLHAATNSQTESVTGNRRE